MKSNWKQVRLGDYCTVIDNRGKNPSIYYEVEKYPVIDNFLIKNSQYPNLKDVNRYIDEETFQNFIRGYLKKDDVIITLVGNGIGNVSLSPSEDVVIIQNTIGLRTINALNERYLFYYLMLNQKQIKNFDRGSSQPSIKKGDLLNKIINLPPLETQKQIAKILSAIDNKIELNNKINDNLEKQAQAILQDWESNNIHHFKISKIDDIAEINASNYSPKENWQYVNYLDTSSITKGVVSEIQLIDLKQDKLPSRAKRKVNTGEIVYSTVRPNQLHFGLINNPLINMLVSTGFAVINSKNSNINNEFLYLQLTKLDVIEKLQQIAEQSTSTFPAIKPSDIGNLSISLPSKEDANMMKILKYKFTLIANNQQQNQNLTQLRDTLLPKLMSGEIDVSKVEI